MDTAHRRIELQAPADLTYLKNNATKAARAKLDLHFPPSAAPESGDDAMKKRVEELVDQYIQSTFTTLEPNLSINGLSGEALTSSLAASASGTEELEPYDTRLASRIQSLSAQIEALTLHLATARRDAPRKAAEAYSTRISREEEEFERQRQEVETARIEEVRADSRTGVEGVKRWEDMRGGWERGTNSLGKSLEGVGGTVAKLERAREAAEVLDGKAS